VLSLILAFLATLLAAYLGPAAALISQISQRQGKRPNLLATAMLASGLCSLLALWLARRVPLIMPSPQGQDWIAGLALLLAIIALLRRRAAALPDEPTHSLFAALLVFIAKQAADSPRWLLFGMTILCPDLSAQLILGGVAGPALALLIAWTKA
jgi:hypothetical protein